MPRASSRRGDERLEDRSAARARRAAPSGLARLDRSGASPHGCRPAGRRAVTVDSGGLRPVARLARLDGRVCERRRRAAGDRRARPTDAPGVAARLDDRRSPTSSRPFWRRRRRCRATSSASIARSRRADAAAAEDQRRVSDARRSPRLAQPRHPLRGRRHHGVPAGVGHPGQADGRAGGTAADPARASGRAAAAPPADGRDAARASKCLPTNLRPATDRVAARDVDRPAASRRRSAPATDARRPSGCWQSSSTSGVRVRVDSSAVSPSSTRPRTLERPPRRAPVAVGDVRGPRRRRCTLRR